MKIIMNIIDLIVKVVTFEFLIGIGNRSNGGGIIAARSFLTSTILFSFLILVLHGIDPERSGGFSEVAFRREFVGSVEYFGAIFGGLYLAFYTRFSSQWSYLADLYNQIKSTEISSTQRKSKNLDMWKAGFMEDAEDLHLATKGSFASVIHHWGKNPSIRKEFVRTVPGGKIRYDRLMERVNKAHEEHGKKYTPKKVTGLT